MQKRSERFTLGRACVRLNSPKNVFHSSGMCWEWETWVKSSLSGNPLPKKCRSTSHPPFFQKKIFSSDSWQNVKLPCLLIVWSFCVEKAFFFHSENMPNFYVLLRPLITYNTLRDGGSATLLTLLNCLNCLHRLHCLHCLNRLHCLNTALKQIDYYAYTYIWYAYIAIWA